MRGRWVWALLVIVVCLGAWQRLAARGPAAVLGSFAGQARWSEGRSVLPLAWRPWSADEKLVEYAPALRALYARGAGGDDPAFAMALAQLYLWRGDTGDLARAEKHLAGLGDGPAALNERALVLLEEGRSIEALDLVERAAALAPADPAVLFNRALLLERLVMHVQAADAWAAFLAVEGEGPWAAEARQRLERLAVPPTEPDDFEARVADLDARLAELRGSVDLQRLVDDPQTALILALLEEEGERLQARVLERLPSLDAQAWRRRVAIADSYAVEREKVLAGRADLEAIEPFAEAEDPLLALRFARLALYEAVQRQNLDAARRLQARIEAICAREGCTEAAVLARSDVAGLLLDQGRYFEAEQTWLHAADQLPATARVRRAELLGKRARLAGETGAFGRATELAVEAARMRDERAAPLANAAWYGLQQGKARLAALFAREAEALARRAQVVRVEQNAGATLAEALLAQGRLDEAADLLDRLLVASAETALFPVLQSNRLVLARVRVAQGRLVEARALLELLVAEARERSMGGPVLAALELLGRVHRTSGASEAAVAVLREAAALATERIAAAPSALTRQRMEAEAASIRLVLAELLAERGDAAAVWQVFGGAALRTLEPDECIVARARLADGWGLWTATQAGTTFRRTQEPVSPLGAGRCGAASRISVISRPGADAMAVSLELRSGAPGVAVVLAGDPARHWPVFGPAGPALAVHSPQPVDLASGLGFLPAAPMEASLVLRTFSDSVELQGLAATPAAVEQAVEGRGLLHFAVHGEARLGKGAASYLLLGGALGRLEVAAILDLPLRETQPVVVLSACRSGGAVADREQDGAGLGWAFLEAGARAVITYQDTLADQVALTFSEAFYGAVRGGGGLSAAFEAAVATVRRDHSPAAAASFVLSI